MKCCVCDKEAEDHWVAMKGKVAHVQCLMDLQDDQDDEPAPVAVFLAGFGCGVLFCMLVVIWRNVL